MSLIPSETFHTSSEKEDSPLISVRLLLRIVPELSFISLIAYVITIPIIRAGLEEWAAIILYSILVMVLNYAALNRLTNSLEQIDIALRRLNSDEIPPTLPIMSHSFINPIITQLNQLIEERATLKTMRGKLYEQISTAAAQEERNRLARDLHDSIKQQVFSMSISAAAAHAHLESDTIRARAALLDVRQSAQEAMVEMRALLQQLAPAPLEKSGLIDALREQVEAFSYRTGAKITTDFGQLPDDALFPIGAQEAVFRIAQEALSNIARHARAHNVSLSLKQIADKTLTLHISDDGQGFDASQIVNGMGLNNIRTRVEALNGEVTLESAPNNGTILEIHFPLTILNTSLEGEEKMQEQRQSLLNGYIKAYGIFIGSATAFFISLPLLFNNPFVRNAEVDIIDTILLGIVLIAFFTSIIVGIRSFLRTQTARNLFLISVDAGNALYYRLQRYTHLGYTGVALAGFWFMPLIWVRFEALRFLSPITALLFFVILIVYYYQSYRAYDLELQSLSPSERKNIIASSMSQLQGAWGSIIGLIVIMVLTDVFRNGIVLMPQIADEWMTTAMIFITVLLFLNQLIQIWYYRQQSQLLEKASSV